MLGDRRRDLVVAWALLAVTAALFTLVALSAPLVGIQRIDDSFLRQVIAIRSGPLTLLARVFNVLGLVSVTLPVRLAATAFLAWKRRWWHLASFVAAIVVSEISIGTLKAFYARPRPPGS